MTDSFERGSITIADARGAPFSLPYRLHRAVGASAAMPAPLLLFLHGAGERGADNERQLIHLPRKLVGAVPVVRFAGHILAPQCPADAKWVDVPWGEAHSTPIPAPSLPMQALLALLDQVLADATVDRARVLLTGLSMGGYGTWDLLARRPELFAAAMPLCGGGDEQTVGRFAHVPLWVWHGARDDAVPVERSRSMVAALRERGAPVRYSELPQVAHRIWDVAYSPDGGLQWLFELRREP